MALATSIILFLIAIIFPFGQLLRLNFHSISFPLIDLAIFLLFLLNIRKTKAKIKNKYFLYFLPFALLSLIYNLISSQANPLKPLLYFFRLAIYLSFFIFPLNQKNNISPAFKRFFKLSLIACITFGYVQYFFWPNATFFDSFNWDPHLHRLIGSFFDPTFTGLIFLLFILNLYFSPLKKLKYPLIWITYLALALTYSRSTLLSFLFGCFLVSRQEKNKKIFVIGLIITLATVLLLPRQPGEGTKLERSSSIIAKIENYQEAWGLFRQSPIIGHGYNNLQKARNIQDSSSHSTFGFDGSLMTILVTTGVIGFFLFSKGLIHLYTNSSPSKKIGLAVILLHSLFANSLLYPWVFLYFILI
jgi:hypothetical protein